MKIFNIMLFQSLGGIEQAFLDYNEALTLSGHTVIPIIRSGSKIESFLNQKPQYLNPIGRQDPFALLKLKYLLISHKPDLVIAHSTKDTAIARYVAGKVPVISVSHGFNFKHLVNKQYIIAITQYMKDEILKLGHDPEKISYVPNMVRVDRPYAPPSNLGTIGYMGRLETIKGCDVLIRALSILKNQGIRVQCLIAGDGSERHNLENLVSELGLTDSIKMLGWTSGDRKDQFFQDIDIFCLPSREETFSIVLLEALANSRLVISSETKGPLEIAGNSNGAIFFKNNDPSDLASKIIETTKNKSVASKITKKGYEVAKQYSLPSISKKLDSIILKVPKTEL